MWGFREEMVETPSNRKLSEFRIGPDTTLTTRALLRASRQIWHGIRRGVESGYPTSLANAATVEYRIGQHRKCLTPRELAILGRRC